MRSDRSKVEIPRHEKKLSPKKRKGCRYHVLRNYRYHSYLYLTYKIGAYYLPYKIGKCLKFWKYMKIDKYKYWGHIASSFEVSGHATYAVLPFAMMSKMCVSFICLFTLSSSVMLVSIMWSWLRDCVFLHCWLNSWKLLTCSLQLLLILRLLFCCICLNVKVIRLIPECIVWFCGILEPK